MSALVPQFLLNARILQNSHSIPTGFNARAARCALLEDDWADHLRRAFFWHESPQGSAFWRKETGRDRLSLEARTILLSWLTLAEEKR